MVCLIRKALGRAVLLCCTVCACSTLVCHSKAHSPPEEERARQDPMYTLRLLNPETRATLEALREEQKSQQVVSLVEEG